MNNLMEIYNKVNQFGNLNNMEFIINEPGNVTYSMPITSQHESSPGVLHGGVMAAFMDAVMGVASLSLATEKDELVSTVEFKLNFLKPVFVGDVLRGEGKVRKAGKRLYVTEGEIFDQNNELVALGQGTFNAYPAQNSVVKDFIPK
tara:strand:- start:80202 stop:80639 length:438 start_codon:yes stop_codon:yes gene_type:complete